MTKILAGITPTWDAYSFKTLLNGWFSCKWTFTVPLRWNQSSEVCKWNPMGIICVNAIVYVKLLPKIKRFAEFEFFPSIIYKIYCLISLISHISNISFSIQISNKLNELLNVDYKWLLNLQYYPYIKVSRGPPNVVSYIRLTL